MFLVIILHFCIGLFVSSTYDLPQSLNNIFNYSLVVWVPRQILDIWVQMDHCFFTSRPKYKKTYLN